MSFSGADKSLPPVSDCQVLSCLRCPGLFVDHSAEIQVLIIPVSGFSVFTVLPVQVTDLAVCIREMLSSFIFSIPLADIQLFFIPFQSIIELAGRSTGISHSGIRKAKIAPGFRTVFFFDDDLSCVQSLVVPVFCLVHLFPVKAAVSESFVCYRKIPQSVLMPELSQLFCSILHSDSIIIGIFILLIDLILLQIRKGDEVVLIRFCRLLLFRFFLQKIDILVLPGDRFVIIALYRITCTEHIDHFFISFRQLAFIRRLTDQVYRTLLIDLDIDTRQIRKSHKELVLRIVLFGSENDIAHEILQLQGNCHRIAEREAFTDAFIHPFELLFIGILRLDRQNLHIHIPCRRIFRRLDIVRIFEEARRNDHREQTAFRHGSFYFAVEILARGQKLIVPDRHIAAPFDLVDLLHDFLRRSPVLLPVAQENVCVKSSSDPFRHLVVHKDRTEEFLQLILVRESGGIPPGSVLVQKLQVSADVVEALFKTRLLHQRKHRDVMFFGKSKFHVPCRVIVEKEVRGHRDNEKLHLREVIEEIFPLRERSLRIAAPDRCIPLRIQNIFCYLVKILIEVILVTAEIDPRPSLRAGIPLCHVPEDRTVHIKIS